MVETTLYSLSDAVPVDDGRDSDRRDGERHMTLYRVGTMTIGDRRELCLIKNISAGGMMIRAYCAVEIGQPVEIELKCGESVTGRIGWTRDTNAGVRFDRPVDVVDMLSQAMDGPRPRMPRIEADCFAILREGARQYRVRLRDISQGGIKFQIDQCPPVGCDVVISLPDLSPQPGTIRWQAEGHGGMTFNRLIPLQSLVGFLQCRRDMMRCAG